MKEKQIFPWRVSLLQSRSRLVWHYCLAIVIFMKNFKVCLALLFGGCGCYKGYCYTGLVDIFACFCLWWKNSWFVWHYCLRMKFLKKLLAILWYWYYIKHPIVYFFLHYFQASFTVSNICFDAKLGSFSQMDKIEFRICWKYRHFNLISSIELGLTLFLRIYSYSLDWKRFYISILWLFSGHKRRYGKMFRNSCGNWCKHRNR